ncbi:hypothetical protein SK128_007846 [Halocaridina rubra]
MRKNVNPKRAGTSALQVYQGSWPLMSQLMFLTSHVKHKPNRPNNKKENHSDTGETDEEEDLEVSEEEDSENRPDPTSYLLTNSAEVMESVTPTKRIKFDSTDNVKIGESEMEILKLITNACNTKEENEENEERLFCLSLVPSLKRLSPEKRSFAKLQIQRILHTMEFPDLKVEF